MGVGRRALLSCGVVLVGGSDQEAGEGRESRGGCVCGRWIGLSSVGSALGRKSGYLSVLNFSVFAGMWVLWDQLTLYLRTLRSISASPDGATIPQATLSGRVSRPNGTHTHYFTAPLFLLLLC